MREDVREKRVRAEVREERRGKRVPRNGRKEEAVAALTSRMMSSLMKEKSLDKTLTRPQFVMRIRYSCNRSSLRIREERSGYKRRGEGKRRR